MTNEIKLNLSAADVQEVKRAMDMGLGLQIGLQLGGQVTVSGESAIDAVFEGQTGAHYRVSEAGTVWQDAAGTTAATADGDPVGRIDDISGNGNHATQSTASARPTLRVSGGDKWLEFAAGDYLFSPNGSFEGDTNTFTVLGVIESAQTGASERPLNLGSASLGDGLANQVFNMSQDGALRFEGSAATGAALPTGKHIRVAWRDGAANINRNNGTQTINSSVSAGNTCVDEFFLGNEVAGSWFVGDIYEAIFLDKNLTNEEASAVEQELSGIYGVTLS